MKLLLAAVPELDFGFCSSWPSPVLLYGRLGAMLLVSEGAVVVSRQAVHWSSGYRYAEVSSHALKILWWRDLPKDDCGLRKALMPVLRKADEECAATVRPCKHCGEGRPAVYEGGPGTPDPYGPVCIDCWLRIEEPRYERIKQDLASSH